MDVKGLSGQDYGVALRSRLFLAVSGIIMRV